MIVSDRKVLAGLWISEKPLNCEVDWAGLLMMFDRFASGPDKLDIGFEGYPMDWTVARVFDRFARGISFHF